MIPRIVCWNRKEQFTIDRAGKTYLWCSYLYTYEKESDAEKNHAEGKKENFTPTFCMSPNVESPKASLVQFQLLLRDNKNNSDES